MLLCFVLCNVILCFVVRADVSVLFAVLYDLPAKCHSWCAVQCAMCKCVALQEAFVVVTLFFFLKERERGESVSECGGEKTDV